ncbi:FAD-dependent monooxygenase [Gemmatimonas sp. UBA7669]|uniref:FAD-dependent monooxygenase n=1 Tax=Gemmatimonas sp. UBA7669 TaxID=1946568 RepID=UPI0025B841A7|nr:FAD-dependent monooxygenase [Gemmatimonas sp. UBA7669]
MSTLPPAILSGSRSPSSTGLDADVIIVGAGPTGLTLAAELAIAKVNVLVLERRANQDLDGSRAGGLHARTLELLETRGALAPFLAAGAPAQIVGFAWMPLDISDFPTRHPYGLALSQQDIERQLLAWATKCGVSIRRNTVVAQLMQDEHAVTVPLDDGEVLRGAWVVGCDGAHSVVRRAAGMAFEGSPPSICHILAELRLRETPAWGLKRDVLGIHAIGPLPETGGGASNAVPGTVRARVMLTEAGVERRTAPTLDEVCQRLREVYGQDFGAHDASWLSWFTDAARQASPYRVGRLLVAGDAAHVHYPTGGQGLNLGMQDAFNLGWKLAQVVRGISDETLLDSYQRERHPVAARVLQNTRAQSALLRTDAQTEALRESVASWLVMNEPRVAVAAMLAGLDVHYDLGHGHPLLGRRIPDLRLHTADGPTHIATLLHDARPLLIDLGVQDSIDIGPWTQHVRMINAECRERWVLPVIGEVTPPRGLLVRPDGHVAWVSEGGTSGLAEALVQWHGCTVNTTPLAASKDGHSFMSEIPIPSNPPLAT